MWTVKFIHGSSSEQVERGCNKYLAEVEAKKMITKLDVEYKGCVNVSHMAVITLQEFDKPSPGRQSGTYW